MNQQLQQAVVKEVIRQGNPASPEVISAWITDNYKDDFGGTTFEEIASIVDDLMTFNGVDPEATADPTGRLERLGFTAQQIRKIYRNLNGDNAWQADDYIFLNTAPKSEIASLLGEAQS